MFFKLISNWIFDMDHANVSLWMNEQERTMEDQNVNEFAMVRELDSKL